METEYLFSSAEEKFCALSDFLSEQGLSVEEAPDFSVLLTENGKILATASLCEDVVKYFAVSAEIRGSGVSAALLTEIKKYALEKDISRLFLVTKPENRPLFEELLFSEIAAAKNAVPIGISYSSRR